jgi:hypothetical protein
MVKSIGFCPAASLTKLERVGSVARAGIVAMTAVEISV